MPASCRVSRVLSVHIRLRRLLARSRALKVSAEQTTQGWARRAAVLLRPCSLPLPKSACIKAFHIPRPVPACLACCPPGMLEKAQHGAGDALPLGHRLVQVLLWVGSGWKHREADCMRSAHEQSQGSMHPAMCARPALAPAQHPPAAKLCTHPAPNCCHHPYAGKTVLMELAILRLLSANIAPNGAFAHKPGHLKAIYLAPARALVQARWGSAARQEAARRQAPGKVDLQARRCAVMSLLVSTLRADLLPCAPPLPPCRRKCGTGGSALARWASPVAS